MPNPADRVEDLATTLGVVVAEELHSYRGYFPALYRQVTLRVRQGLSQGRFSDPLALSELTVRFAGRYLDARHKPASDRADCWDRAFDAAAQESPIVLQHLLLGINAHINFDLAIAAADTLTFLDRPAASLKTDFEGINEVLEELFPPVLKVVEKHSPGLPLSGIPRDADQLLGVWGLGRARAAAWRNTKLLLLSRAWSPGPAEYLLRVSMDEQAEVLARAISLVPTGAVRSQEPKSPQEIAALVTDLNSIA